MNTNPNPPALFEAAYLSSRNNTMVTIGVPEPVGDCGICLESFDRKGRMVATCEAKHLYHKNCLFKWFDTELLHNRSVNTCPTCRREFPSVSRAFYAAEKCAEIFHPHQGLEQQIAMMNEKICEICGALAKCFNSMR